MKLNTFFLVEANVYNINQPYNGVSVQAFVSKLLSNVPADVRPQIEKKLAKLIVNDDTVLTQLTNLPDNAPDWAKASAAAGDLRVFVPDEDIVDRLTHISHFVQTLATDAKSKNKDTAAVAVRELQGLPKVENLGVLYTKSNEYFARGSRHANRQVDGMEEVATTKGYTWYKLATPEAFVRAGKTLQNCIGRIYTYERCVKDGTTILVMRDRSGHSVVAMRLQNGGVAGSQR